ncbi:TonB-dependent receptor [Aquisalimonas asiatica]|uniref:Iron complex outermembrane recepter protein n=1 Tax=Aquisalimonas asiatica TaxID=406100 RepID=A0A1H8SYX6_9GAMM|nr:TonB-dependent receptor [Aquisalimonas asiatica]SEO83413.1 iron complex outermembrane recepter protein [Aquisalimonas asiatica]
MEPPHKARMLPLISLFLGVNLPLTTSTALAQDEQAAALSPLEVSATRSRAEAGQTPQKMTVIDREQIEQQLAITSDRGQILSNLIPGYSPSRQKMTNSGETFRGRSPLVMIDGVPQSNPLRDSSRDSYTVDLDIIERIEVIHGASAEHGLGATGGVINLVTKSADGGPVNQRVAASITAGTDLSSEGLGHKLGYQSSGQREDWDYLLALTRHEHGAFFDGDGTRVGVDPVQGDIQDSTSYDMFGKLGYWLDENQNLQLSINRFEMHNDGNYALVDGDRDAGEPTTSRRGSPDGQSPYNRAATANLTYSHGNWRGNELDAQLYYQRFRAQFGSSPHFPYQDADGNERLDQTRNESDKLGAKFTLRREGLLNNRLGIATGLDLIQDKTRQTLVQTNRDYVPETRYRNIAAFLQGEFQLLEPLALHAGVRQEYAHLDVDSFSTIDRDDVTQDNVSVGGGQPSFDETLFNVGLVYQATDWAQLFANYSEGFGMPDVGRVLRGIDEPGRDVDELLELDPIVTDNIEIGTRINWHPVNLEVSYFQSNSDLGQRLEQRDGVFVGQREKTEIQGVEVSGRLQVNDSHRLNASWARSRGKSDTTGDGRVDTRLTGIDIAPERLSVGWDAGWTPRLATRLQVNHSFSKRFSDQPNPNLDRFDGHTLVDASVAYQLPAGSMRLGVENVLDETYFTYYSQTARDGDDQYFRGRGRTVTLGYSLDF